MLSCSSASGANPLHVGSCLVSFSPVLLLVFNRPDTTALVMNATRAVRPAYATIRGREITSLKHFLELTNAAPRAS